MFKRTSFASVIAAAAAGTVAAAAGAVLALPAAAQTPPERTVDDYICELSGDCGGPADPASQTTADAGDTKGFAIARAGAPAPRSPVAARAPVVANAAATRNPRRAARPTAARPAVRAATAAVANRPVSAPAAGAPAAVTAASVAAAAATAIAPRRADLRLGFALGSDQLDAPSIERARTFAQALKTDALAGKKFMIEGHTDSIGGRAFNRDLSQRRAQSVANFLIGEGVSAERLEVRGFGFDRPVDGLGASSPDNRRVEAVVVP